MLRIADIQSIQPAAAGNIGVIALQAHCLQPSGQCRKAGELRRSWPGDPDDGQPALGEHKGIVPGDGHTHGRLVQRPHANLGGAGGLANVYDDESGSRGDVGKAARDGDIVGGKHEIADTAGRRGIGDIHHRKLKAVAHIGIMILDRDRERRAA